MTSSTSGDELEAALGTTPPSPEQAAIVSALLTDLITLEKRIETGEAFLKDLKAKRHDINTKTMPDALASLGTTVFKISEGPFEGWGVEIKPFVAGSLPKEEDKREAALDWVREHQASDIIKSQLAVEFDRGEDEFADKVKALLDELGVEYEASVGIHAMTLIAFANERMKNGEEVPLETLGLFAGRTAKIKPPKEKKVKK